MLGRTSRDVGPIKSVEEEQPGRARRSRSGDDKVHLDTDAVTFLRTQPVDLADGAAGQPHEPVAPEESPDSVLGDPIAVSGQDKDRHAAVVRESGRPR